MLRQDAFLVDENVLGANALVDLMATQMPTSNGQCRRSCFMVVLRVCGEF